MNETCMWKNEFCTLKNEFCTWQNELCRQLMQNSYFERRIRFCRRRIETKKMISALRKMNTTPQKLRIHFVMCRIHEIWSNSAGGKRNTSRFGWLILSSGYQKKGYPFFGPKKRRIHSKVYDITIKKAEFILREDVFMNFVCVFIKK